MGAFSGTIVEVFVAVLSLDVERDAFKKSLWEILALLSSWMSELTSATVGFCRGPTSPHGVDARERLSFVASAEGSELGVQGRPVRSGAAIPLFWILGGLVPNASERRRLASSFCIVGDDRFVI